MQLTEEKERPYKELKWAEEFEEMKEFFEKRVLKEKEETRTEVKTETITETEETYDLFGVSLISKRGGFRDVMFNQQYKAEDSGGTIDDRPEEEEEKYCYKDLKKIEITFNGDKKVYLQRVLRAMLDDIDSF